MAVHRGGDGPVDTETPSPVDAASSMIALHCSQYAASLSCFAAPSGIASGTVAFALFLITAPPISPEQNVLLVLFRPIAPQCHPASAQRDGYQCDQADESPYPESEAWHSHGKCPSSRIPRLQRSRANFTAKRTLDCCPSLILTASFRVFPSIPWSGMMKCPWMSDRICPRESEDVRAESRARDDAAIVGHERFRGPRRHVAACSLAK